MTVRLLPFAASSAWGIDLLVPIFATLGHVYIKTDGGVHNNPIIAGHVRAFEDSLAGK